MPINPPFNDMHLGRYEEREEALLEPWSKNLKPGMLLRVDAASRFSGTKDFTIVAVAERGHILANACPAVADEETVALAMIIPTLEIIVTEIVTGD